MDLQYFIKTLWSRKWLIAGATLFAIMLTYFLAGLRPPVYKSNAVLSTGITVEKSIQLSKQDVFVQKYEIESAFSNLIATMRSRTSIRMLSAHLLLHELQADSLGAPSFRKMKDDGEMEISEAEISSLIRQIRRNQDAIWAAELNKEHSALFKKLAKAYDYDFERITENLKISRLGETDYLNIEFESENPELSEYVVNTFASEFIRYNIQTLSKDENDAVRFYNKLALRKKERLDTLTNQLRNYRQNRNIVNLDRQSEAVVAQIKDLELSREAARKDIEGHRKNIGRLNDYLSYYVLENTRKEEREQLLNEQLTELQQEIKQIRINYIDEISPARRLPAEELKDKKAEQELLIGQLADHRNKKDDTENDILQNLLEKRIDEEIQHALKKESVHSIDEEIQRLNTLSQGLVISESHIETLESEKEIAMEEYLQAISKLNDARVVAQSALNPLSIFEHGQVSEEPEPSKRLLFAAFAGASTASASVFLLFFLILFDNSLSTPHQFEKLTQASLLGTLTHLKGRNINLNRLLDEPSKDKSSEAFKESLRKIRHQIETSTAHRFLITSLREGAGKTLSVLSLAYALGKRNKKVLIVDTNFKHNTLSGYANIELLENPLLNGHQSGGAGEQEQKLLFGEGITLKGRIDVIGNYPSSDSPSEILAGKDFREYLSRLEQQYDYILMEGASLNEYSDTRELTAYADKVIAVFEAPSTLSRADRESLEYLNGLGHQFMGGILNQVDLKNLN